MKAEDVDKVAQGRVWSGEQAVQHGLADEIGGLRQAIAYIRQETGLDPDSPIVELPKIEQSLLSSLIGIPGLGLSLPKAAIPKSMVQTLKVLAPFMVFDGSKPLSRLEISVPVFE
jgi:protease IV